MRKTACALALAGLLGYFALPTHADDATKITVTGVLIDQACATGMMSKDNPEKAAEKHTRACATKEACEKSGYALIHEKELYKLDKKGDKLAKDFLKTSNKEDDLKVTIVGEKDGDTLKVDSLTEAK